MAEQRRDCPVPAESESQQPPAPTEVLARGYQKSMFSPAAAAAVAINLFVAEAVIGEAI